MGTVNGFVPVVLAGRLVPFEALTPAVVQALAALVQLVAVHSMLLDQ